jgi:hypothetical protein
MSMKNSNDTIWNRTHDPLACSAMPQSTAPPHASKHFVRKAYRIVLRIVLRIILRLVFSKLNCVDVNQIKVAEDMMRFYDDSNNALHSMNTRKFLSE